MVWSTLCKLLQKQTYDVLSHRYGTYLLTGGIILVIVSGFQFGEVALEWSQEKYAAVFNSFSDNLSGKSYQSRLCLPVPIDVVYTWVNGSDPQLLAHLRSFKAEMEMELNETRTSDGGAAQCPFAHCILSLGVVLEPSLPPGVTAEIITKSNPVLSRAVRIAEVKAPSVENGNITVLFFGQVEDAKAATEEIVSVQGQNFTIHAAYYTTDWTLANSVPMQDTALMTGFPHTLTSEQLMEKLPEKFHKANAKVRIYESEGVAVIETTGDVDDLLNIGNFTIEGKEPTLNTASLIWNMQDVRYNEEIAASRFADNEELRYSLRSVQTFAPWVRHIYLVTNGQIPAWLNLDNPRLTVVTHQEIFVNTSHLPAFSSPSIEAHLHRIPGLSDKFIYMNDDVMFGKEVWPDDFFTHAHGQKIYLTWPVPNCQDGCPSSWIRDGYCDKACNNTECEWDGGDCAGSAPNTFNHAGMGHVGEWNVNSETMYCNSGCANNWVADRYCDQSCNVKECGFDAGDCGVSNFDKLTRLDLKPNVTEYTAPKGETVLYMNISAVFGEGVMLEEGTYEDDPVLRTSTIAQKYKTLTIILFDNMNSSCLHFHINGKLNETTIEFTFNVSVDSTPVKTKVKGDDGDHEIMEVSSKSNLTLVGENVSDSVGKVLETAFKFEDIDEALQYPHAVVPSMHHAGSTVPDDLTEYALDPDVESAWKQLQEDVHQGDITERGLSFMRAELWGEFIADLKKVGKVPIKSVVHNFTVSADDHRGIEILHIQPLGQVGRREDKGDTMIVHKEQDGTMKRSDGMAGKVVHHEGMRENTEHSDSNVVVGLDTNLHSEVDHPTGRATHNEKHAAVSDVTDGKKFDNYLQRKQSNRAVLDGPNQRAIVARRGKDDDQRESILNNEGNVAGQQDATWLDKRDKSRAVRKLKKTSYIDRTGKARRHIELPGEMIRKKLMVNGESIEKTVNMHQPYEQNIRNGKVYADQKKMEWHKNNNGNEANNKQVVGNKLGKEPETGGPLKFDSPEQKRDQKVKKSHHMGDSYRSRKLHAAIPSDLQDDELEIRQPNIIRGLVEDEHQTDAEVREISADKPNYNNPGYRIGFLPWEKQRTFSALSKKMDNLMRRDAYVVNSFVPKRNLLDTFGDSLRHVNRLYNAAYGYSARKVPAHMPHFVDRQSVYDLQARFPKEWDATSSHRIRSSTDMQFAFSYMYYVISEPKPTTVGNIFAELDNDNSGVLSDRELRTMATRLYDLPLDLQTLTSMERLLINCSQHLPAIATFTWGRQNEVYYEKEMPQVTKYLINNCEPIIDLIQKNFKGRTKFRHEILDDSEIAFKMIHTNVSQVVGQLDDIRRHPRKFICLNDNMDHSREEAKTVKAVLVDFYESILPTRSEFELPREYRNRFLHTTELREWRKYRDWLKLWTQVALAVLILFTIGSFFADKFTSVRRRLFRSRAAPQQIAEGKGSPQLFHKPTAGKVDSTVGQEGARPLDVVVV